MAISKDDLEQIQLATMVHTAKIIASIDMLTYKLDEFKKEAKDDIKILKEKVYTLEINKNDQHINCSVKKEVEDLKSNLKKQVDELDTTVKSHQEFVSNHKHLKKFLYAAILFGVPFIIFMIEYFLK